MPFATATRPRYEELVIREFSDRFCSETSSWLALTDWIAREPIRKEAIEAKLRALVEAHKFMANQLSEADTDYKRQSIINVVCMIEQKFHSFSAETFSVNGNICDAVRSFLTFEHLLHFSINSSPKDVACAAEEHELIVDAIMSGDRSAVHDAVNHHRDQTRWRFEMRTKDQKKKKSANPMFIKFMPFALFKLFRFGNSAGH